MTPQLAFIGLGIMGRPMAGHLLRAGNSLTVFNRTSAKANSLVQAGAKPADSPAAAARDADVVFVCVTDTPDVEAVLFGRDGVFDAAREGAIVVDHSTISPAATKTFAQRLAKRKIQLIDAPVSGGDSGAKHATLAIMCGGDRDAFEHVRPLLGLMGKTIAHCGPSGAGQLTKLVNQVLVLGTLAAVCEAMTLIEAGGLDPQTVLNVVSAGAAKSWQLENLAPKIAAKDFAPGFMIDLAAKDLRLVLEQAATLQLEVPGTARVLGLLRSVQSLGGGGQGTPAMIRALTAK